MQLIRVADHLGVRLPPTPPPFSALMAGVNPGPVPVHRTLPSPVSTELGCLLHDGTWNSLDLHNRGVDHLVHEKLGDHNDALNSLDHVDLPRRHDKDVDDLKRTSTTLSTGNWGISMEI